MFKKPDPTLHEIHADAVATASAALDQFEHFIDAMQDAAVVHDDVAASARAEATRLLGLASAADAAADKATQRANAIHNLIHG